MYDSRERGLDLHRGGRKKKEIAGKTDVARVEGTVRKGNAGKKKIAKGKAAEERKRIAGEKEITRKRKIVGKKAVQEGLRLAGKGKGGRRGRRKLWKPVGLLCVVMMIGGVSLAAVQVLASAGNRKASGVSWHAEAVGEADAWGMDSGQDIRQMGMVSANVAVPETAEPEVSGELLIVIDAGHGGMDEGCVAGDAVLEKDMNLAVAKLVQGKLETMGYRVLMVREDDSYIVEGERAELVNGCGAAVYVGIYQNFSEDKTAEGIEVWYDGVEAVADSKRLAQLVGQQAVKKTDAVELGLREGSGFPVASGVFMPSCFIKTGFLTNDGEREKLMAEEYQEQMAEGIAQGIEYYFHPKTMYLTFDDGPAEENTSRVLDVLKERGIKATFFVVGENVRRHPEVAKRIVDEGHTIGIHCDSHAYDVVYESVDSYLQDFERAYETVKEVTGVEVKLFRFPGGSVNAYNGEVRGDIIEAMTERGFIYFDWNASLEDAVKKSTPEQLVANGVETTLGRKKVVMLAHDVVYNTGICLEDLLDRLPEYRLEVLTEDVEPVQF